MLKILQARLQQYVNRELPDVQAGFRKGRGTRDQMANICWIMEEGREFQKNIYFFFIAVKLFTVWATKWESKLEENEMEEKGRMLWKPEWGAKRNTHPMFSVT